MKNDDMLKKYQSKIFRESIIKSLIYGLIVGFVVVGIVSLINYIIGTKSLFAAILIGIMATIFASCYVYKTKFKASITAVAKRIDELGLHERVITMVDYADSETLICVKQREDTQEKLAKVETKSIKFRLPKATLALLAVTAILATSSLFLPNRGNGINANNSTSTNSSSSKNSTASSTSSINIEDQIEDIIQKMIEEIRKIIDNADISETSKEKLHLMVDEMVVRLDDAETLADKIKIIQDTKEEIRHQINLMKSVSLSLQEYEATKRLGEAIALAEGLKEETEIADIINAGVDGLINDMNNSEDPDQFLKDLINGLEKAIEIATEEENTELVAALSNLLENLKNPGSNDDGPEAEFRHKKINVALLAGNQANSAIEDARQEIIEALLPKPEDPDPSHPNEGEQNSSSQDKHSSSQNQQSSGNQNESGGQQSSQNNSSGQQTSSGQQPEQDIEDTQDQIDQEFDNALDQLDKIEQNNPQEPQKPEQPGDQPGSNSGNSSGNPEENNKPIFGDGPLDSDMVIDGQTPYLDVYEEYYNEIMEYLAGNEIPDEIREIIETYFEMIK